MLVLRRKAGEAIVLNGVITIHVLAVEGERVKLGISAPPEVVIVRSELLENGSQMPGQMPGQAPEQPQGRREQPRPYSDDGLPRGQAAQPDQSLTAPPAPQTRPPSTYTHPARFGPRRRSLEPAPATVNTTSSRYRPVE